MRGLIAVMAAALLGGGAAAGSATAADLMVDMAPMVDAPVSDWGQFYAQVYGGVTLAGYTSSAYLSNPSYDSDIEASAAFGASLGVMTPIDGLAFDLDIMKAGGGAFVDYPDEAQSTLSIMVDAEYSVPVGDMVALYGKVGVGVIGSTYYGIVEDFTGWGAGYQLAAGARVTVSQDVSLFGELKYQNSFQPITIDEYTVQYPTVNALVGLRFAF